MAEAWCRIDNTSWRVPLPIIYLSEESDGKNAVIDDQQRLTSFIRFLDGEFSLRGLTVLAELNGKKCAEFDKTTQNKITKSTILCIIAKCDSHPGIKFEIFECLNTGSVKLNDQELRNWVYDALLHEFAEDTEWLGLIGTSEPDRRMRDCEMMLRFFAFYYGLNTYKPPMKRFLNIKQKGCYDREIELS